MSGAESNDEEVKFTEVTLESVAAELGDIMKRMEIIEKQYDALSGYIERNLQRTQNVLNTLLNQKHRIEALEAPAAKKDTEKKEEQKPNERDHRGMYA